MTSYTTHYGFIKPTFATTTWHDQLGSNFDRIDTLLSAIGSIPTIDGEWTNNTAYTVNQRIFDTVTSKLYRCLVAHTSAIAGTFTADFTAHPTYWALIDGTTVWRGQWVTATAYSTGDTVYQAGITYRCAVPHTSGTFATDLAAVKWEIYNGINSLALTGGTLTGSLTISTGIPYLTLNKTTTTFVAGILGQSNGSPRWEFQLGDTTAESGGNAGSNFSLKAYSDGGVLIDTPITLLRIAGGTLGITRPVTLSGGDLAVSKASPIIIANANSAGQDALLSFRTGNNARWAFAKNLTAEGGANAGSDLEVRAYADNGAAIDTPISLIRAAGGAMTIARPFIAKGVIDASDAAAGNIGEYKESIVLTGSAVGLTTATGVDVTSLLLAPGDWDVEGFIGFNIAGTTSVTRLQASTSLTSATIDVASRSGLFQAASVPGASSNAWGLPVARKRVSVSANTTVYLVANCTFTVSTLSAFGTITARRVR